MNPECVLFAPDRPLTYQEPTTFLLRVLGYCGSSGDFAYAQALSKAIQASLYSLPEQERLASSNRIGIFGMTPRSAWLTH
jgi:hypothetical protein